MNKVKKILLGGFCIVAFLFGFLESELIPIPPKYHIDNDVISVTKAQMDAFDFSRYNSEQSFVGGAYISRYIAPECIIFRLDSTHIEVISLADTLEQLTRLKNDNKARIIKELEGLL